MTPRMCAPMLLLAVAVASSLAACGDDAAPPAGGTITLARDEGVDFGTGKVRDPGNYANSDLFATANGDSGMKLASGGDNPTHNRPITWFFTPGGLPSQFPDLASVPRAPLPTGAEQLVHAKTGNGFLLETADGDHVRGWLAAASATSITIEWQRVILAD